MRELRKSLWTELSLFVSFFPLLHSTIAYTAEVPEQFIAAGTQESVTEGEQYTVNFNNVAIIEIIRFASKIGNVNFIFDQADLQFNVTVVSEEAVSAKNILSVLAQVLRTHDLILVEQEGNILITKSTKVNAIPTIVSSDLPETINGNTALVTRVFRIKNANINSIANIIRPMTSDGALIEISAETRQLIVTDVASNVDQVASLLASLDAPHTPLEIESYGVKNVSSNELITLTQQILAPFTEGNPLIFVPQEHTNSIYIVSTPYLIERALVVLEDLDIPPRATAIGKIGGKNVFLYKPQHRQANNLLEELKQIGSHLKTLGGIPSPLETSIENAQLVQDSNSLMFFVGEENLPKLKEILSSLDTVTSVGVETGKGFYLYKLQAASCSSVLEQLHLVASKLPSNSLHNQNLISAIEKIECIPTNNALFITGSPEAVDQIKTLIAEFDVPKAQAPIGAQAFLIYKPKFLPAQEIQLALSDLSSDLKASGLEDPEFFQTIGTLRYVESTNSLVLAGRQETLDRIQAMINNIDTSNALSSIQKIGNVTFFVYKIQYSPGDKLIASLKSFAHDLKQSDVQDKQLAESIEKVRLIKETNSLLFTGNSDTLQRIEDLLKKFDLPSMQPAKHVGPPAVERAASTFVIYTPKYVSGDELISVLCDFMQNLLSSGVSDPGLADTISNLRWIDKTSSLLISGNPQSVEKVQDLLVKFFDVPNKEVSTPSIESIDNTSFLVYKLQYHPGNDIQMALKQVATTIGKGANPPTALAEAINSLQWVQVTNSLLCSGQQDVLVKLKELIQNIDVPLRQVFIELLVIETTLSNIQNFGLMWGAQSQYFNKATMAGGNFPLSQSDGGSSFSPVSIFSPTLSGINATNTPAGGVANRQVPFVSGFDLGVIGDIIMHKGKSFLSLGTLVNAIQEDNDSVIVLNPKIITQDNRQSTIFVGQNIPYTGAIVTNSQSNTTTTANIEYRDVGMSLTITPILGADNVITMDIVQDISEVINNGSSSSTSTVQLTGIQTSHTHMETRVQVPDNFFVALSGMINDSKQQFRTAIPCLGGLPVIGALFSENDRTASKTNVIIFVRPKIVTTYEEYKKITEHQEWLYKDSARLPVLKEWFDESIDLVKLPENE